MIQELCDKVVNDLKEHRERQNLTTAELAVRTSLHQPNITRMETGAVCPNLSTVAAIAYHLGMEIKLVRKQ